jgi:hypothetical protein
MGSILIPVAVGEAAPTADDIWELIKAKRTAVNAGGVKAAGDRITLIPENTGAVFDHVRRHRRKRTAGESYVSALTGVTMSVTRPTVNLLKGIRGMGMR